MPRLFADWLQVKSTCQTEKALVSSLTLDQTPHYAKCVASHLASFNSVRVLLFVITVHEIGCNSVCYSPWLLSLLAPPKRL